VKKLHIESDIVLQSDKGTIKVQSNTNELVVDFSDWTAVSSFFTAAGSFSFGPFQILRLTKNLEQHIAIRVNDKPVVRLSNGRINKWKFFPLLKFFRTWRRSG